MYGVYRSYYAMFKNYSMLENCHFANVATPTKYGSWNLLEYQDQNPADCPRYSAIQDIIEEARQSATITTEASTEISTDASTETPLEATTEVATESTISTDATIESSTEGATETLTESLVDTTTAS
jgi:hypothetical protein